MPTLPTPNHKAQSCNWKKWYMICLQDCLHCIVQWSCSCKKKMSRIKGANWASHFEVGIGRFFLVSLSVRCFHVPNKNLLKEKVDRIRCILSGTENTLLYTVTSCRWTTTFSGGGGGGNWKLVGKLTIQNRVISVDMSALPLHYLISFTNF